MRVYYLPIKSYRGFELKVGRCTNREKYFFHQVEMRNIIEHEELFWRYMPIKYCWNEWRKGLQMNNSRCNQKIGSKN